MRWLDAVDRHGVKRTRLGVPANHHIARGAVQDAPGGRSKQHTVDGAAVAAPHDNQIGVEGFSCGQNFRLGIADMKFDGLGAKTAGRYRCIYLGLGLLFDFLGKFRKRPA